MNPVKLILEADIVVKAVIILLILLSIISWAIIIQKMLLFRKVSENIEKFMTYFQGQTHVDPLVETSQNATLNPLASMFLAAYQAFTRNKRRQPDAQNINAVEHALERAKASEVSFLENRVSFLATTGSSAPFIGLFGTVWGIMNAFLSIGAKGATNLAVVAPGIAEALIATAIGLVAAIPAVIGYNYCVGRIRTFTQSMEQFSSELGDQKQQLFEA